TIELTASQAAVISGAPGLSDVFATFAAGIPSIEQFAEIMRTTGLDADLLGDVLVETRLRAQELADGFAEQVVPTVADAMSELNDEDGLAEFVATLERQAGDAANFVANIASLYARG
ncbi:hypothetical protein RZS08_44570, partial [Arthrospira platensis SPKY1]|nr:hypothetical protein [Arthrospira platensis SPKY1]